MNTLDFADPPIPLPGDESTSIEPEDNKPIVESLPDTSSIELISCVLRCGHPQIHVLGDFLVADRNNSTLVWPYSLGRGSFCDVTTHCITAEEALHLPDLSIGDMVACKRYQVRDEANPYQNRRNYMVEMRRELRILLHPMLQGHRNISRLLYIGWETGTLVPALVSQLADYGNLEDFLSSANQDSVTDVERLVLTKDIASGLHALHQLGFAYRDLKLSNVLVDSCPLNGIRAVLTDFSGSIEQVPGMLAADKGHYTPEWAAPEELAGYYNDTSDIYDYRLCDIYSFGIIVATLWIEEYIKPLSPIPCFLSSYCKETNGTSGEDQSKNLEKMKEKPDDAGDSPISVALAKLSANGASLVGDILRLTLCREPENRVQMDRVLLELGFPNVTEKVQHVQVNQVDIALNSYTLLSTSTIFREQPRSFQSRVLGELMRIAELAKAVVKDKCPDLNLPESLSDDESELWETILKKNFEVHTKPLGREKNSLFATLAFDIALCSFYGLGTSVNETQGLEWLLFSANLGNDWAMGMTVPVAFSINENEETKSWMRLHLALNMLKGSHHSTNYLTRLYPDDCIALRGVIQKRSEGRDSTAEIDHVNVQLERWVDHFYYLYNASTPSEPFNLDQGISLYLERCAAIGRGFMPNNPHLPLETDLAWTAKALCVPVTKARDTEISITTRWISMHCFLLLFEQGIDELIELLDILKTRQPGDLAWGIDVIPTATLGILLKIYENPDMNLSYRLKLGGNFKHRQIEMLQLLLNSGADPFLSVATEDRRIMCPFICSVLVNNVPATELMLEHAIKRGVNMSEKLVAIAKEHKAPVGQLCILACCDLVLDLLLSRGFCTVEEVCFHNDRMVSIINYAAAQGDSACIGVLVKHAANLYSTQDVNGLPPFTRALLVNCNIKTAALLLPKSREERHRIFTIQNRNGYICFGTVLNAALNQNRGSISIETIEFLRDAGAMEFVVHPGKNLNVFDVYFSYISRGGDRRDLSSFDSVIFAILLEAFHNPEQINARIKDTGMTLLQIAVWRADRRAVELLLQYGKLDINAETHDRATAFDLAAYRKRNPPEYIKEGGVREIRKFYNALSQIICLLRDRDADHRSQNPAFFINSMSELHNNSNLRISIQILPNGLLSISDRTKAMLQIFSDDYRRNPLILDLLRAKWPKRWTGSKTSGLLELEDLVSSYISKNDPLLHAAIQNSTLARSTNLWEPARYKKKWYHKLRIRSFFSFVKSCSRTRQDEGSNTHAL